MAAKPAVSPVLMVGAVFVAIVLLIAAPLSTVDFDRSLGVTFVPPGSALLGAAFGGFIIPVIGFLIGSKVKSKKAGVITFIVLGAIIAGLSILRFMLTFAT